MTTATAAGFSLLTSGCGPVGGTCGECASAAIHRYQRGETVVLACAEHECTLLHGGQPSQAPMAHPTWCIGCSSWVDAP